VVSQVAGLQAPLASKLSLGHISHADQTKLMLLYPFGDVGAALSEEVIYRFGIVSTLMGLMSFARIGGRSANNDVAFWIANIAQAAFFGFIHVQQGIATSQIGGMAFATLTAPPTWSGVVLGYVFRRWGIEAAIVTHILADIAWPICLLLLAQLSR
jgi:membrane protease YdiL (CAAX protease family)